MSGFIGNVPGDEKPWPAPVPYGWKITRDWIAAMSGEPDRGTMGPRELDDATRDRLIAGEGEDFRMLDDDGEIYYSGILIVNDPNYPDARFAPLDDFGMPDGGATRIEYRDAAGKWAAL